MKNQGKSASLFWVINGFLSFHLFQSASGSFFVVSPHGLDQYFRSVIEIKVESDESCLA